jgi:hypothetical protein
MKNLKVYRFGNIAPTLKCEMGTIIREPETLEPRALVEPRIKLKPPVSRQQLLEHTEDDPKMGPKNSWSFFENPAERSGLRRRDKPKLLFWGTECWC